MLSDAVLRLRPSPWKQLMLTLVCAAFVAVGGFLVSRGDAFGWVCVALFGAGMLVFLVTLLPGSSYLELRRDGFEMRSLYRKWFVRWSDVQLFFPTQIASTRLVCWNYMPGHAENVGGRNFSARLTGVEAALPDTYGLSADELAEVMNEWLLRHAVQSEAAILTPDRP